LTSRVPRAMPVLMPRVARIVISGNDHHVTQRGNNRQDVFFTDDDRRVYLTFLGKQAPKHGVRIVAYCLMTNHVQLVVSHVNGNDPSDILDLPACRVPPAEWRRILRKREDDDFLAAVRTSTGRPLATDNTLSKLGAAEQAPAPPARRSHLLRHGGHHAAGSHAISPQETRGPLRAALERGNQPESPQDLAGHERPCCREARNGDQGNLGARPGLQPRPHRHVGGRQTPRHRSAAPEPVRRRQGDLQPSVLRPAGFSTPMDHAPAAESRVTQDSPPPRTPRTTRSKTPPERVPPDDPAPPRVKEANHASVLISSHSPLSQLVQLVRGIGMGTVPYRDRHLSLSSVASQYPLHSNPNPFLGPIKSSSTTAIYHVLVSAFRE